VERCAESGGLDGIRKDAHIATQQQNNSNKKITRPVVPAGTLRSRRGSGDGYSSTGRGCRRRVGNPTKDINLLKLQGEIKANIKGSFKLRNTNNGTRVLTRKMAILLLLSLAPKPSLGLGLVHIIRLNFLEASQQFSFYRGGLLAPRQTPIPEDQASAFISPRGRVATYFSRLLQHAWITVGLFLFPGHHTGKPSHRKSAGFQGHQCPADDVNETAGSRKPAAIPGNTTKE
jgi:hypothetical protein